MGATFNPLPRVLLDAILVLLPLLTPIDGLVDVAIAGLVLLVTISLEAIILVKLRLDTASLEREDDAGLNSP